MNKGRKFIIRSKLLIFSKNWVDKKTRHYVMPKVAGNYALTPRESIIVDGQISSACINDDGNKIILGGYNKSNGACFMWMLWDFKDNFVFNGNKRRIELGSILTIGQYEATAFKADQLYFTDEKKFTDAGLWSAEINQWFSNSNNNSIKKFKSVPKFVAFQKDNKLIIETKNPIGYITIYNSLGVRITGQKIINETTIFSIDQFSTGVYTIDVNGIVQKILIER